MILVKQDCKFECQNVLGDENGRIVCVQICYTEDDTPDSQETMYTLCNIYAPNSDDPDSFLQVVHMVSDNRYAASQGTIVGGDFNLVMNH